MTEKTLIRLESIMDTIEASINLPLNSENGFEISARIVEYSTLLALSGEAVALSKYLYGSAKVGKATTLEVLEHQYRKDICERQNSALVHSIDGLRSVLSLKKTEMATHLNQ